MLRKLPIAALIAALLIAIPGVWALSSGPSASADETLSPGNASTGIRSADERVAFWEGRIAGDTDHLNRVQAGVALLELARQRADSATYDRALAMADAALAANPSSLDARILRGAALSSAHRFDEALGEAEAVLDVDGSSFQGNAVAADALLELGRYDEAFVHLDALVREQPQAPAVLARLAEFSWDTGDETSALTYGTQALARANEAGLSAGELSFYAVRLARFRLDTGDTAGAEALAEAALGIAPEVPAVHSTLGFVHRTNGDLDAAAASFEAAVALAPLREALVALEELATEAGDHTTASEWQRQLAALPPAPGS